MDLLENVAMNREERLRAWCMDQAVRLIVSETGKDQQYKIQDVVPLAQRIYTQVKAG